MIIVIIEGAGADVHFGQTSRICVKDGGACDWGGPACFSFMVPRFTSPTASNGETAEENKDSLCCWSHVGWMEATLLWFSIRAVVS